MKSRVSQLLIAACLSASMALAAVPAGAAPVFAAEETDTAGTEQGNSTGKSNTGTPAGERESSGGTQDGSQSSGQNNTSEETKDDEKDTAQGGTMESSQGGTQGSTDGSTEENGQQSTTGNVKENTSGGTQDGSQGNDDGSKQGAITSGEYITPPATVQWIDKDNLILGISPVDGADWYEIEYIKSDSEEVISSSIWYSNDFTHQASDNGLYQINIKRELQDQEATFGEEIKNPVQIRVYAGKGSPKAVRAENLENADYKKITVDNYQSYLSTLKETPMPTDVELSLDDTSNKLVVSFKQEKVGQWQTDDQGNLVPSYPYEYHLYFYLGSEYRKAYSYDYYTDPGNLIWSVSAKGTEKEKIEIPVSDYIRSTILEKVNTGAESRQLSVAVKAKAGGTDSNGNLKYKVSQLSAMSNQIDYKNATFTTISVNEDQFKDGSLQNISSEDTNKLCPEAPDNASLRLEVKANTADENDQKTEAFKKDAHINASYSDFSTFEVNLNLVTKEDGDKEKIQEVTETASTLLITIPIPLSLRYKPIVILRNHGGTIEEVGSVVSADGKTVSFYTDKFSDYAIAVKKDNPGTVEEGGKDNPSTDPITPSDPGTSVTTPSAPSGPDTSAAVKTVSDTTAAVKGVIDASTLAESSKKLAGSLIDAIKAEADKKMAAASSQSDANAIAEQAKKDIEAVQARAEKAGKIGDVPAAGDLPTAVQYGMIKGYINGTSDTDFQPAGSVTRAQFAAFLYRLAGSPETSGTGSFSDTASVSGGADFAKAIAWAAEQGIAQGFGDGTFRPYETVTREQAVAFLHRYMKGLTNTGSSKFTDVKDGSWYAADINWGVANGIINGYADNSFGVGDNTTRGQAVQFIYRALASGSAVSG